MDVPRRRADIEITPEVDGENGWMFGDCCCAAMETDRNRVRYVDSMGAGFSRWRHSILAHLSARAMEQIRAIGCEAIAAAFFR